MIEQDHDFWEPELIGLQNIYLPTEADVCNILRIWEAPPDALLEPRETEAPI